MTEQVNPTVEDTPEEETTTEAVTEKTAIEAVTESVNIAVESAESAVESAIESAASAVESAVETVKEAVSEAAATLTGADETETAEESGDPEEDATEEPQNYFVEGPTIYVQPERGGRPRRIGSDVRFDNIDYKNVHVLVRFLDQRGRILSRRKTRVSAKVQRRAAREIRRARHMALLPYTGDHSRLVRKRR